MTLVIRTTGLEQYAPGGEARVKVLLIGGPGAGKTRWSSYFPKPIYADCEGGLASVADRRVPYVSVNSSTDMADFLSHLKMDGRLPKDKRTVETVVIDTLDAYQRKLKTEWLEINRKESFSGFEAWGFLDQKMQLLLTRLLNLDVNIVVAVHYKDKVSKDEDKKESHELMLQLSGDIKDTAFNDFDLVGWIGTYWEAVGGERVEKRGISFKRTPDKPFLKDRLHVTPPWLEVVFASSDYANLFARIAARADELAPSETVGEIGTAEPETPGTVTTPERATSGALPAPAPVELPLAQLDKPTLLKKARELGITTLNDGSPIKGNTLKSELIAAIEHHQAQLLTEASPARQEEAKTNPDSPYRDFLDKLADTMAAVPKQAGPPAIEQVAEGAVDTTTGELLEQVAPLGERALELDEEDRREQARQAGVSIHDGPPAVLEAKPPTTNEAIATVQEKLSGEIIAEEKTHAAAEALARITQNKPAPPPTSDVTCTDCGKDLAGEDPNYVKLSQIKYRTKLCQVDYQRRKTQS